MDEIMSEENLEMAQTILKQDINAYSTLLRKDNLRYMNVIANRFLENCLIFDDYHLCLPGIFLKDMVNDYHNILNNPEKSKRINSARIIGETFISRIKDYLQDLDEKKLWQEFFKYNKNINNILRDEVDNCYLKNLPFTSKSFKFLLEYLENNKRYLFKINNKILEGILSTMVRIIRNHSFSEKEIKIYIYIKFLNFLYEYLYYENLKDYELDETNLKNDLSHYFDYLKILREDKEVDIIKLDKALWNIIKKWREMYLFYKDVKTSPKGFKESVFVPFDIIKQKYKKNNEYNDE